jgi:hypothetical protein
MTTEELKSRTFVGVVEDNMDPKRLGRCKVRITNVFDKIPTEDLPWASPWKDLNGNGLFLPEVGKVVSVVFDSGNRYKPEYIHAEHFNTNLQEKLNSLSESDYKSMRALMFDHKTQIFSTDSEGLVIDYKINNINITDKDIDLNLKDNFGTVNIGTANSTQQAILGNHFMEWFDEFVDNLAGLYGGAYLDSRGAPVVGNVKFLEVLNKFKLLKDPKFLSKHVKIVDNEYVKKIE